MSDMLLRSVRLDRKLACRDKRTLRRVTDTNKKAMRSEASRAICECT